MSQMLYQTEVMRDTVRSSILIRDMFPQRFGGFAVKRNTQICIEGAARSGNTFTCLAVQCAWPEVKLAHHTHCPSNVIRGVRAGIPTYVLIRAPEECVTSSVLRQDMMFGKNTERHMMRALVRYMRLYSVAYDLIDHIHLIDFPTVVNRPEAILQTVARSLGDRYVADLGDPGAVLARAHAASDRLAQANYAKGKSHLGGFVPDDTRKTAKVEAADILRTIFPDHLERANDLYRRCQPLTMSI